MPSPILARADALMQRRVSGHAPEHDAAEDFPILTDALDEEEEIPILLQVEAVTETALEVAPQAAPAPPADTVGAADKTACPSADLPADLAHALESHLQASLQAHLQAHLQAALPGLIEQAVAEVMARRHPPEPVTDTPEAAQ
jgi:hypothetical protein